MRTLLSLAMVLAAGTAAAQTVVVPRTTITVDEQPMVVQPAPFAPGTSTPSPEQRRRRTTDQVQQTTPPSGAATPVRPRPRPPARPSNGYSSFLTGPIDLTRPPEPQR